MATAAEAMSASVSGIGDSAVVSALGNARERSTTSQMSATAPKAMLARVKRAVERMFVSIRMRRGYHPLGYTRSPMRPSVQSEVDASGLRVGVVTSQDHDAVTSRLLEGARECFLAAGGVDANLLCASAPGSYELIAIAHTLALRPDLDAVVCLGCVLTGETRHDEYLCEAVANGLAHICATTGKPVAFGVLTCPSIEHANARSGGAKGNKGEEAMRASIAAAQSIRAIKGLPLGRASR